MDEDIPSPPRPLPAAVAQMAARLLVAPERAGSSGLPVVAGYELLVPLGRGGMGVVYQARHITSGRMVALKMFLGGAHTRLSDLARFKTEAEAVALLAHPQIVQIEEVGEYGGWAYFALEFVAGGSLAYQLAGRPQSANPAARLVESVAHTMAYAHERGIVHRDLKPANILLTPGGSPKITDFGLAKRLDLEPETCPSRSRTQTGDVLGTPSYMAPEQTTGRTEDVGTVTDVYALGAILYECLTGRPPFQASTPLDTLLQVRDDDPVSPRRLVPSVPRNLDTICLKCLQKEPHRRYQSAAGLAEDLRRFLAGEPIRARPASLLERTVRWARRRKATAALISLSASALVAVIVLGAWHQAQLQSYNTQLQTERDVAEQARELAQTKETEALQKKNEAEAHFRSALAAVQQMLVRVSEEDDRLAHEPRMELVRSKLLEDALRFYQGLLKQRPDSPEVRREIANTLIRVGDNRKRLGQQSASEEAYNKAIEVFHSLSDEFPKEPNHRHDLAGCYTNLGNLLANTTRIDEAERSLQQARAIQQELVKELPASTKFRVALAGNEHNMGTLLARSRRLPEAEQVLRQALEQRRRLANEFPHEARYRQDLARTLYNLARVLDLAGRSIDAEPVSRQALDLQKRLAEEFPRDPYYRLELAGSHNILASALDNLGRLTDAESQYLQSRALLERLVDEFPRMVAYRQELAYCHNNLAMLLERNGRPQDAEQSYRRGMDLLQRLVDESPGIPGLQNELGRITASLAELFLEKGELANARQFGERAVRHQKAALKLHPNQTSYERPLAQHYRVLTETLVRLNDHMAAAQAVAEMPRPAPFDERMDFFVAGILGRCIPLAEQDSTLPAEKRNELVKVYGDQAINRLRDVCQRGSRKCLDQLKADSNLASLRPRADFQKLLRDLEETNMSGKK